jgi:hypothetical protein
MKFAGYFKFAAPVVLPLALLISAQAQTGELARDERWREDVRFYARELPQRHKNLFFQLPKDEFEREIKNLEVRIPKLSDGEIALELMRITARVGDGHTSSSMPESEQSFFPIRLERFKEGWFATQTTTDYEKILGGQIIKIGDVKVPKAAHLLRGLISAENEIVRESRLGFFFTSAGILKAKGIWKTAETGEFTFIGQDGERISIDARPLTGEQYRKAQIRRSSDSGKTPFTAKNTASNYWFEYLPEAKTLYLAYNKCTNAPEKPFAELVKEIFAVADSQPTQKFVVDLRRNGGGNSAVIWSLYGELKKRPQLIKKGNLFVLVSSRTFSSAFMNALEMRNTLNALWVGEAPGQKPNAYGEVRQFQLPNSKIVVQYSTKFWELMKGSDIAFVPVDVPVQMSFSDYTKGHDQVLQAALDYKGN